MSHYAIVNENEKFFLNLCGHYSLVDDAMDATVWDDPNHKEMWFYLHELKASTNRNWYVIDLDKPLQALIAGHSHIDESEDAINSTNLNWDMIAKQINKETGIEC